VKNAVKRLSFQRENAALYKHAQSAVNQWMSAATMIAMSGGKKKNVAKTVE
jgi:hypothetical protein